MMYKEITMYNFLGTPCTSWNMSIQAKAGRPRTKHAKDVCQDPWQEKEDVESDECYAL